MLRFYVADFKSRSNTQAASGWRQLLSFSVPSEWPGSVVSYLTPPPPFSSYNASKKTFFGLVVFEKGYCICGTFIAFYG